MSQDSLETRQALRTRIARQRRRLDRQIDSLLDSAMLVGSWRKLVERNPGRSLISAAGIGAAVSNRLSSRHSVSALERQLRERIKPESLTQMWRDFLNVFESGEPRPLEPQEEQQDA